MLRWLTDWLAESVTGYGTQLSRVVLTSAVTATAFSVVYWIAGVPKPTTSASDGALQAAYFSLTTFATLGYGDLAYGEAHPWLRILSTLEALTGAAAMALVVTVLARKWFR